ncbi:MAG TPA: 4Fe-4S dicluster-binding protein, partial [Acidisarcina sp.]
TPDLTRTPAMVAADSARRITVTPIPKLDEGNTALRGTTPLERIPRVDEHHCVGCNLCSLVCPVEDCITMERIDKHLPSQTWEQRTMDGTVPDGVREVFSNG